MYILYNILILIVLLVFVLPYYTYRLFTEKGFALRFKQQVFGKIDDAEIAKVMRKDCIWIHGASVGEIVATSPLVKQIRKSMPERPVLVSAFTVGATIWRSKSFPKPMPLFISRWIYPLWLNPW